LEDRLVSLRTFVIALHPHKILALCTLQVRPDCDEKYSRKRHRISAIAAA